MIIIIILKSVYIVKCTDLSNLFNFFTLFLTVKKYFHWETTSLVFFFSWYVTNYAYCSVF